MRPIARCVELRCTEPAAAPGDRCARHQAAQRARHDANLRRYALAADMLHTRTLAAGDTERAAATLDAFTRLVAVWDHLHVLRRAIDLLPFRVMEPLSTTQVHLADQCVWCACRMRAYVAEGAMGFDHAAEVARLADQAALLAAHVECASQHDRATRVGPPPLD